MLTSDEQTDDLRRYLTSLTEEVDTAVSDRRLDASGTGRRRWPVMAGAAAAVLAVAALVAAGFALGDGSDSQPVTVAGPDGPRSAGELDGLWRVVATLDDGERQPAEGAANLRFDGDRVHGDDGCNNRIEARLEDGVIVGPTVRTQVACSNEAAAEEADLFWTALGQPVDIRDGELWLVDGDGDGLVFAHADGAATGPGAEEPTEMSLEEARDAWLAGDGPLPTNDNPAPLLPADQRAIWIESFQRTADCMHDAGFPSFPDAPATFGDGRTRSPLILVPSDPAEHEAFTTAMFGDCALDTSQLDLDIFQAAMDAAVQEDELTDLQQTYLDEVNETENEQRDPVG